MSVLHPVLIPADAPEAAAAVPVRFVGPDGAIAEAAKGWAGLNGFAGKPGQLVLIPGPDGALDHVLVGAGKTFDPMSARGLAGKLPTGVYRLEAEPADARKAALAFALGTYVFDRYKDKSDRQQPDRKSVV